MRRNRPSETYVPATPIQSAIALSCLISVVFGVALISTNAPPPKATLMWVIYVAVCGITINRSNTITLKQATMYGIAPALSLVASLTFMYLVGLYASSDPVSAGSGIRGPALKLSALVFGLYAAILLATIFGIGVACVASQSIIEMFVKIDEVPLNKITSLKAKLAAIAAIMGAIFSYILIGFK
jgi:hypothetical protein